MPTVLGVATTVEARPRIRLRTKYNRVLMHPPERLRLYLATVVQRHWRNAGSLYIHPAPSHNFRFRSLCLSCVKKSRPIVSAFDTLSRQDRILATLAPSA